MEEAEEQTGERRLTAEDRRPNKLLSIIWSGSYLHSKQEDNKPKTIINIKAPHPRIDALPLFRSGYPADHIEHHQAHIATRKAIDLKSSLLNWAKTTSAPIKLCCKALIEHTPS